VAAGAQAWHASDSTRKSEDLGLAPVAGIMQPQFQPVDADVDVAQGDRVAVDADPKPSLQRAPRPAALYNFRVYPRGVAIN
jgi:hypothetical protein